MKITLSSRILLLSVILAIIFIPGFLKIAVLKQKNRDLLEKNKKLEQENTLLKTELQRLEEDHVFQEKLLREKMGVVRKDEVPIKIVGEE
ncbi:MAG: septum formation initiator family protein [Candidatus Omnitrophica bacterium]|nr:septum formation initiator family protein [Candidatus Omnitrophota bacterium]